MRPATQADRPAIEAFLGRAPEKAMFPLSNLAHHGMAGGHPYAVSFWLQEDAGEITGILTRSENGMLMPRLPCGGQEAARAALGELPIAGVIGPAEDCRPLIAALGLEDAPTTLDRDEPQFALDLSDLILPDGPGTLRPMERRDMEQLTRWMTRYHLEALGTPVAEAEDMARGGNEQNLKSGTRAVLEDGEDLLATTAFNASLPQIVQIGGVFTPPELRRRGHARRAVALHLAEARAAGVERATLFAASDRAARAYRAIGFQGIGQWTLTLYDGPQVARG